MRLREPATRAPEAWTRRDQEGWSVTYHVEVVTPLFGGGVEAGTPDAAWPVRATAIRGQLRFWWRILAAGGGRRLGGTEFFQKERDLWGGLDKEPAASRVRVAVAYDGAPVKTATCGGLLDRYREGRQGAMSYALFPGLEGDNAAKEMVVVPPIAFSLRVSAPTERREEVEETLRWWASFGGIGGRTRRGLGAVRVEREDGTLLPPVTAEEAKDRRCELVQRGKQKDAVKAWTAAVGRLRDFRQGKGTGRNPGKGNRPGRSHWPEPESVRRLSGQHRVKADGTSFQPAPSTSALFPRAVFGMPIIFQFQNFKKDRPEKGIYKDRKFDPKDHTLQPAGHERLASPLILKAQAVEGGFAPIALLLPHGHVAGLDLALSGSVQAAKAGPALRAGRWWDPAKAAQVAPLQGRGDDALTAFMAFFAERA